MEGRERTVGVIGLGLIGGSIALNLKETGFASKIIGNDLDPTHANTALTKGIVDKITSVADLIAKSEIIILAIPVDKAVSLLTYILDNITGESVVMDVGSTKERICKVVACHPNRKQYVACHPIAGTEDSGPLSAGAELFVGKVNIICDSKDSSDQAMAVVSMLIKELGMDIKFMASHEHDRHIAYVSHMSHISSIVLGQTVLEVEKDERNIFDLAGSGFESTVRLAKSSPEMWAPILCENAENITEVLDAYIKNLQDIRQEINSKNAGFLKEKILKVNKIRKVLEGRPSKIMN